MTKKKNETVHLGFLIDESGSMGSNREAVVTGYNEFVAGLREDAEAGKDIRATLSMFDLSGGSDICRVKFDDTPLEEVRDLTIEDYRPRGSTPLNDALVRTLDQMGRKVAEQDKAMLIIMTDGYENASETKSDVVRQAINQREKEGWTFIYLGANQDVWAAGNEIGLGAKGQTFAFAGNAQGTGSTMRSASTLASTYSSSDLDANDYRSTAATVADMSTDLGEQGLSEEQRKVLDEAKKAAREGVK